MLEELCVRGGFGGFKAHLIMSDPLSASCCGSSEPLGVPPTMPLVCHHGLSFCKCEADLNTLILLLFWLCCLIAGK